MFGNTHLLSEYAEYDVSNLSQHISSIKFSMDDETIGSDRDLVRIWT